MTMQSGLSEILNHNNQSTPLLGSYVYDQIPAELIKAGGGTIRCAIYKLIIAILNKEELPGERKESIIVPIHQKGIKQIVITIGAYHFCQLRTKYCPTSCSQG